MKVSDISKQIKLVGTPQKAPLGAGKKTSYSRRAFRKVKGGPKELKKFLTGSPLRSVEELELRGIQFTDAWVEFFTQDGFEGERLSWAYVINGKGPAGIEYTYYKSESQTRGFGQSYLYVDGNKHQVSKWLKANPYSGNDSSQPVTLDRLNYKYAIKKSVEAYSDHIHMGLFYYAFASWIESYEDFLAEVEKLRNWKEQWNQMSEKYKKIFQKIMLKYSSVEDLPMKYRWSLSIQWNAKGYAPQQKAWESPRSFVEYFIMSYIKDRFPSNRNLTPITDAITTALEDEIKSSSPADSKRFGKAVANKLLPFKE